MLQFYVIQWRKHGKRLKTENLESVHLKNSKKIPLFWKQDDLINKWKLIRKVRRQVNTAIEQVRNKKLIGSSLEAEIFIYVGDNHYKEYLNSVEMKKNYDGISIYIFR